MNNRWRQQIKAHIRQFPFDRPIKLKNGKLDWYDKRKLNVIYVITDPSGTNVESAHLLKEVHPSFPTHVMFPRWDDDWEPPTNPFPNYGDAACSQMTMRLPEVHISNKLEQDMNEMTQLHELNEKIANQWNDYIARQLSTNMTPKEYDENVDKLRTMSRMCIDISSNTVFGGIE